MDLLDHRNAMNKLNKEELKEIDGGSSISGSFINAIANGIKAVLDLGRSLGSAIRRISEDKMCAV